MTADARKLWVGNIPLNVTEGMLIRHFRTCELPTPWKALVRIGGTGKHQHAVVTMESAADAQRLLETQGLRWGNGDRIVIRHCSCTKPLVFIWRCRLIICYPLFDVLDVSLFF